METKLDFWFVPQMWDDYTTWFIFSDDGLVSCRVFIYNDTPKELIISDLYVNNMFRKRGYATAILNRCFEFARERGCNSVSLRSTNDDWVRQWYMRLGFCVESSDVWLKLNLNE